MISQPHTHPVLACAETIAEALKDVADVDPVFMSTADKQAALLELTRLVDQVTALGLRVMANAEDVAEEAGDRDVAAWLAHRARRDRAECRRMLRLARALDRNRPAIASGLRDGTVNLGQAQVIDRAVTELPDDLDPAVVSQAEEHLVAEASQFGPRSLRILGRGVLAVVDPDAGEDHERRLLEREEVHALRRTYLKSRRRGDGTTDLNIRTADAIADRLFTYLEAYTSPRHAPDAATQDRRPYDEKLGHAFGAFLEAVDPRRTPLHSGDATTVVVTIDYSTLTGDLGVALAGDQPITAGQARRLACTAGIIPAVLGGNSEILDLGRSRRLFSPAQRKAMAIRNRTCRAEGCDIPAAWCEAHHATHPWSQGGRTDLDDGALLCSFHHHRAHDHRYDTRRMTSGDFRFNRRT